MTAEDFWNNIDSRLKSEDRTLKNMADGIGLNYQTLSMQRIRKTLPKLEQLIDMSDYFGITLDELVVSNRTLSKRALRIAEESDHAREEVLFCIEMLLGIKKESDSTT